MSGSLKLNREKIPLEKHIVAGLSDTTLAQRNRVPSHTHFDSVKFCDSMKSYAVLL